MEQQFNTILRVRFWTSQTGLTFAQVTLKDEESKEMITRHLDANRSGLLYDAVHDVVTKPKEK